MALQSDPGHVGNIGDQEPEEEPDIDRIYEQGIGCQRQRKEERTD